MAIRRIRDNQTGEIIEVDESELGKYGLTAPTPAIQQQPTTETPDTITGKTLKEHGQALQRARAAGDSSAVKAIKSDYDMELQYQKDFGKEKGDKEELKKVKVIASQLKGIEDLLTSGKISTGRVGGQFEKIQSLLGVDPSLRKLRQKAIIAAPILGKNLLELGRLTDEDVRLALSTIPTETDTPEETFEKLRTLREILRDRYGADIDLGKGEEKLQQKTIRTQKERIGGLGGLALGAGGALANFLLGSTKGALKRVREKPEETFVGTTPPVEKAVKSAIPLLGLTDPKYRRDIAAPGLEIATLLGLPGLLKKTPKAAGKITGAFRAKPAKLGKEALEEGAELIKRGGDIRTAAVSRAESAGAKVDGTKMYQSLKKWAKRTKRVFPRDKSEIDDFVKEMRPTLKGKKLNPKTAKKIWDDADSGFTAAGQAGKPLTASFNRALRSATRSALDDVAKGFDRGTKLMAKGFKKEKLLKTVRTGLERKEIREGLQETPSTLSKVLKSVPRTAGAVGGGLFLLDLLRGRGRERDFR